MADDIDLSVVVVTHDGGELALTTLASARASLGTTIAEWFAVDCGSTDGTPDAVEANWPDVHVIRCPNVGFAAGNNVALRRARGRYVLLLNPDVEIASGTLADVVRALDRRPEVGAASVVQVSPDGELLPSIRRFPSPARQLGEAVSAWRLGPFRRAQERVADSDLYDREHSADWVVGSFLVVRRAALEEIGLLDERFFMYSEETDLCFRLREAGWDVRHLPELRVIHHGGGYERSALAAQLAHSKVLFARKHLGRTSAFALRAALVLGHLLRLPACASLGLFDARWSRRARGEAHALALASGLAAAPLRLATPTAQGGTP